MSGHTPGPWSLEFNVTRAGVIVADGGSIAAVWPTTLGDPKDLPVEANARLIAAAPELLEALILMRDNPSDNNLNYPEVCAAILKATGGAE